MPEREKVIRGLTICTDSTPVEDCRKCPYHGDDHCTDTVMMEALALLREQEAVRPETIVRTGMREEPTIQAIVCGNCLKIMGYCVVYNFCPWCGRAVKWDA